MRLFRKLFSVMPASTKTGARKREENSWKRTPRDIRKLFRENSRLSTGVNTAPSWAPENGAPQEKNLWRRKCVRRAIFRNVEGLKGRGPFNLTLFATRPLGHCATCQGSSYTKNEYNLFYQKLDAEYFFIQQFFQKKQYFQRKLRKTVLGVHLKIF